MGDSYTEMLHNIFYFKFYGRQQGKEFIGSFDAYLINPKKHELEREREREREKNKDRSY